MGKCSQRRGLPPEMAGTLGRTEAVRQEGNSVYSWFMIASMNHQI